MATTRRKNAPAQAQTLGSGAITDIVEQLLRKAMREHAREPRKTFTEYSRTSYCSRDKISATICISVRRMCSRKYYFSFSSRTTRRVPRMWGSHLS